MTQLVLGADLSLALDDQRRLWCWGRGENGQCGGREDVTRPVSISGLGDVVRVAVGGTGVCAITDAQALWCWGKDRYRRFVGVMADESRVPVRVDPSLGIRPVDVRGDAADDFCVLDDEGAVTCWGPNLGDWADLKTPATNEERQRWFRELGGPAEVTRGVVGFLEHARPVCVWKEHEQGRVWECLHEEVPRDGVGRPPVEPRRRWPQLALSGRHGCVAEGGRVTCWGEDGEGQVGPAITATLDDVVQVATGSSRSCALREEGAITCWGDARFFATGDATMAVPSPVAPAPADARRRRVASMPGIVGLVAENTEQPCAIEGSGRVRCLVEGRWRPVSGLRDVVQLSTGDTHACARTGTGGVYCWGQWYFGPYNHDGDDSDFSSIRRPRRIGRLVALSIASQGETDCALARDGSVQCWGRAADASLVPRRFVERQPWVEIAMSERWSCGRDTEGTARCWAWWDDTAQDPEIEVEDVVTLAVAGDRGCALHGDGTVRCWGEGPVGDGTWMDRASPVALPAVRDARALSVGITHACVHRGDGAVLCWGDNDVGQLGDGTTRAGLTPTEVDATQGLGAVVGVSVVSWRPNRTVLTSHAGTAVWTESGEVWLWGESPQ